MLICVYCMFIHLQLIVFFLCFVMLSLSVLHIMLLLARVDLSLLSNGTIPWMRAALKSLLAMILSFFRWLHRKAYNWIHLQLARWRLRRERARYERGVPLQERLERERQLAEINAQIAAVLWTRHGLCRQRSMDAAAAVHL